MVKSLNIILFSVYSKHVDYESERKQSANQEEVNENNFPFNLLTTLGHAKITFLSFYLWKT